MPAYTRIHADLLTDTHRIYCRIEAGPMGIIGLLNDVTTSLFEVEDAYISRLQQPAKILEHRASLAVTKALLTLAFVPRREELGPLGLARGGYSHVTPFGVLIITSAFEIRGQLELPGKLDTSALLTSGTGKFICAYKAKVLATLFPDLPYDSEAVIINRNLIQAIAPDTEE